MFLKPNSTALVNHVHVTSHREICATFLRFCEANDSALRATDISVTTQARKPLKLPATGLCCGQAILRHRVR